MPEQALVLDRSQVLGDDMPREKCGIVGVYSPEGVAVPDAYEGLNALQHRGHDGAGFSYVSGPESAPIIITEKALGRIAAGFPEAKTSVMTGPELATGHVRYGTTTAVDELKALHPLSMWARGNEYTVAHNGEFSLGRLIEVAQENDVDPSGTDTELFARTLSTLIERRGHIEPALLELLPQLEGAFNLSILTKDSLYAVRDRHGMRPLVVGHSGDSTMFASEVGALDAAGYRFSHEIAPGTYVAINRSGIHEQTWSEPNPKACLFEFVYISKQGNVINGTKVGEFRYRAGQRLADRDLVTPDLIIPVLGSAKAYAHGYADAKGSDAYTETALIKDAKSGRTFIAKTQAERAAAVAAKFRVNPAEIDGKVVSLVDDSLVRGTTMTVLVDMLKGAGAKEVHVRIGSAEYVDTCAFGVNVQDKEELLSHGASNEQMAATIGATSLLFLTRDDLYKAVGLPANELCDGCMGGSYPTPRPRPTAAVLQPAI